MIKQFFIKHINKITGIVIVLFFLTMFLFPEPETNFGWYVLTGMGYVILLIIIYKYKRKTK